MQYFKPSQPDYFAGDAMPHWLRGRLHVFYLLDRGHHTENARLGGHQWAHISSADLVKWDEHPIAVPTGDPGEPDEKTICTGSVIEHDGVQYAFYATRIGVSAADHTQHVCLATSTDGIHFRKCAQNPILSAKEGYWDRHFRDPHVIKGDDGQFHMLVTTCLRPYPLVSRGGCLAHLTSADLKHWTWQQPLLVPGLNNGPECPDLFFWNGWYYLTFLAKRGQLHYRMSRSQFGPWERPQVEHLDGPWAAAIKTAPIGDSGRRMAVGFIPSREGGRDDGRRLYAGNLVFRELVQHADGTLGTRWLPEMIPASGAKLQRQPDRLTGTVKIDGPTLELSDAHGLATAIVRDLPRNARIRFGLRVQAATFAVNLRTAEPLSDGYQLVIDPLTRTALLSGVCKPLGALGEPWNGQRGLTGLDAPMTLDIIMKDDIIDVCLDNRRCLVNRAPEQQGTSVAFACGNGRAVIDSLVIEPIA